MPTVVTCRTLRSKTPAWTCRQTRNAVSSEHIHDPRTVIRRRISWSYGTAWNTAAAELFRGALTHSEQPNLVRWVFLAPDAHDVLPDWTDVAQGLLARLRARAGRHPGVAAYTELESELRGASPEADRWWSRYDVGIEGGGIKRVRLADGGVQRLAFTSLDVSDQPNQTMTTYRHL